MPNFVDLIRKIKVFSTPQEVPAEDVKNFNALSPEDMSLLKTFGVTYGDLSELVQQHSVINYERQNLYKEVDRAITHPLVGSAMELYAEVVTTYSQIHNSTVWITAENKKYETILNKLLDSIGVEERIFDWAYTTATYGDMFAKINGQEGVGVLNIEDDEHPINLSRLDYNGRLVGFFDTPLGYAGSNQNDQRRLIEPWHYVHFRLLGVKKKRPVYNDPQYSEYRTIYFMSPDQRRVTSKYGSSLLTNALASYKRLRLAEDSLLLGRLSKGILRYIYKVKVDSTNYEAVSSIIDMYKTLLKRARAMDVSQGSPFFDEKYNPLGVNEDIIIPVWGDANDLTIDKIGGEGDIRFIADIEELRNQLSAALRVPLQMLGGYTGELPGGMGTSALERLDIRFARSARRLQRALIYAIKRLCQIHLAYLGMDPDPSLFEVNMAETSSAEEEELKDALDKGIDIAERFSELLNKFIPDADPIEVLDYVNTKLLKLHDLDLDQLIKPDAMKDLTPEKREALERGIQALKEKQEQMKKGLVTREGQLSDTDLLCHLPTNKDNWDRSINEWNEKYKDITIKVEEKKEKK